jgi:molecular chaperone DnaK
VLATNGNTGLGGDDLDRRILDFLVEKLRRGGPDAAGEISAFRIREVAEQAKIKLSTEPETEIIFPSSPDVQFQHRFTRFELRISRGYYRPHAAALLALDGGRGSRSDLDQVILVGGQTHAARARMVMIFGCVEFEETRGSIRPGRLSSAGWADAEHLTKSG